MGEDAKVGSQGNGGKLRTWFYEGSLRFSGKTARPSVAERENSRMDVRLRECRGSAHHTTGP